MKILPIFQKEKKTGLRFEHHHGSDLFLSISITNFFVFFLFFFLFIRLFQLTIVKGSYYARLSEENRIRELIIEPLRGKIVDRKNLMIANNLPVNTSKNSRRLPSNRLYLAGEQTVPIVGYRQIADPADLKNDRCFYSLQLGDKVGKKGVEKLYDCDLRGRSGKKLIEVDAQGNYLKTLSIIPPIEGKTIQLALDLELQQKAYQLLEGKKGAVIAVKPQTGELLILASTPSYNPQLFENGNEEMIKKIINDENKPLFNRGTEGIYPPGSIFKLVLAAGALEEKIINEKSQVEDTGIIQAGPLSFGNWYYLQYGKTEGMVNVVKAIQRSNDIFFYKTGEELGREKIKFWAEKFGFGKESGFGLGEATGLIPSPFWKAETLHERWYLGDSYNLSIGQGYVLVTPLQVTMATAAIANGGYLCQPQLTKVQSSPLRSSSYEGQAKLKTQSCKKISVSNKTLGLIQEGMKLACSPGGTGWPLFNFKVQSSKFKVEEIQTACKTGTAESHAESKMPHAWFTVYAPADKPEIALTVLLEEAGQGSDIAGPIAKEILKTYFERKE